MVKGTLGGTFVAKLESENHTWLSGLKEKVGGQDEGPDPHRLLEGALVACTLQTLALYAKRKDIDISGVAVSVNIDSEDKTTQMTRNISLPEHLGIEQKDRLIEIANKCPIHRVLSHEIEIKTVQKFF